MKKSKESGINRIWTLVAAGCVVFVALICVAGIWFLHSPEKTEQEAGDRTESSVTADVNGLAKDVEAVKAQEAMQGSSFSDSSGDSRKPIRIVEVIPHPIYSVFPYMIDWGTVEEYNENTYLGYEGVRVYSLGTSQSGNVGNNNLFSLTQNGLVKDTLDNYNVEFIRKDNWWNQSGWWRENKMDENILQVNGYFEYVGNNKGLYNINLNELVKEGSTEPGIRYDIMAMKRKGTENKQGEWEVKDARYYWAKDYAENTTYPATDRGEEVKQKTGYNYDLQFQAGDFGEITAQYRIHSFSVMTEDATPTEGYEYAAYLADGAAWTDGYRYSSNGNYSVGSYTPYVVNETTDLTDKYIRVNSDNKVDDSDLSDGYFRLCTGEDNVAIGDTVYGVTFTKTATGKTGSYILNPAAVKSAVSSNSASAFTKILFEYVGETEGNYDIAFIYGLDDSGGALYSYSLLEVSNGNGRYALTSTESDAESLYEEAGEGNGDYSKVVTAIDCAGIDYTQYYANSWTYEVPGYYINGVALPGLTVGRDEYDELNEHGNWVFHTVDSDEVNGITKIEELENGSVPANKRIYVYGQNRKNRYYAQNGFENNEWFKLLLYLSTEDGSMPLAYQDYAEGSLTALEIKEKYKADIEAFDRAYRFEIIQKTPGQLTVDDVEKADLLYFAGGQERYGLAGMNTTVWNNIISQCGLNLATANNDNIKYTDDLSTEVLFAIYHNCLYEKTTSLLFSGEDIAAYARDYSEVTTNLGKMGLLTNLFDDPTAFAYFIDGYEEKNEDYTTIHRDTGYVSGYWQDIPFVSRLYNFGYITLESRNLQNITGGAFGPESTWRKEYFRVVELAEDEENDRYKLHDAYATDEGTGKYGYGWGANSWWGFRGQEVTEGDRVWYIPSSTADSFFSYLNARNVWQILHNKKSKETSEPVVVVTNADGDNISELDNIIPIYYYYVDGFALGGSNSEFDIEFMINWRPEEIDEPNSLTNVVVTRSGGGTVYSLDSPSYKTKYICNVANHFIKDGSFDYTINSIDYEITATDSEGKTDTVIVRFIVREAFMLN